MTTLAVTSTNSLRCHASTCFRIGSKFRCMRSTPTEMQSMSENDFECFASTGVNTPVTLFPNSGCCEVQLLELAFRVHALQFNMSGPAHLVGLVLGKTPH